MSTETGFDGEEEGEDEGSDGDWGDGEDGDEDGDWDGDEDDGEDGDGEMDGPASRLPPPPRRVPFRLITDILFGGELGQFGWGLFAAGMIIVWSFLPDAGLLDSLDFRGTLETAEGVVEGEEFARCYTGFNSSEKVFAIRYSFRSGGVRREGVSYVSGRPLPRRTKVLIEFPKGNPSRSRIQGLRSSKFGLDVNAIAILPLFGLTLALVGFFRGLRAIRLLARGQGADAVLVSKTEALLQLHKTRVYTLTFRFQGTDQNPHEIQVSTHWTAPLEDDPLELVLYDPARPERGVMFDFLAGPPRIDPAGRIQAGPAWASPLRLLIPAAALLVNLAGALGYFTRA